MKDDLGLMCEEEPPGTRRPTRSPRAAARVLNASSTSRCGELSTPAPAKPAPATLVSLRLKGAAIKPSPASRTFRKNFFPETTESEWNDWRWQIRNRVRNAERLSDFLKLRDDEARALAGQGASLPFAVTPYYLSLLDPHDAADPLRKCVVPSTAELLVSAAEAADPLAEDHDSPTPGLVHRYPDRVLFLTTGFCSTYCRYCTRTRLVGRHGPAGSRKARWEAAIDYIQSNKSVRDVLLSGGDPLTLPDEALEWLLKRLRAIKHVEIIRIGTKVPAVLPQRVTTNLARLLKRFHPLMASLHFTHPAELTPEARQACTRLADAGVPLGSQTVFLKGVNNDAQTLTALYHGLLQCRVRPYYLYQCDPIPGSAHFRTSVAEGLAAISGLRGHTSGYAVPTYVIDAPGGGGKIPLLPDYCQGRAGDDLLLANYEGKTYRYPDPAGGSADNSGLSSLTAQRTSGAAVQSANRASVARAAR